MNSPIVRAIDVGFGNIKYTTASNGVTISTSHFPALAPYSLSEKDANPLGSNRRTVSVKVGDLFYEVGPDVGLAAGRFQGRQLHDGYSTTNEYRALTAGALHYMREDIIDLLVVGLPVSQFAAKRTALAKAMTGSFDVGRKSKVEVRRVLVVAQPQGALFDFAAQCADPVLTKGRNLVVDVGSRTFDWLVTDGMKPLPKMCHSVTRGVSDILIGIAQRISEEVGEEYRKLETIDHALRTGRPLKIYQRDHDLKRYDALIQAIAEDAVLAIVQNIDSLHDLDNVVLAGGGAEFFKKAMKKHFKRHPIREASDPLCANVRGFQLMGEQYVREKPELFDTVTRVVEREDAGEGVGHQNAADAVGAGELG